MTEAAETVTWSPSGNPVRNFILAGVALAVLGVGLGGTGATRPRVQTSTGQGEFNMLTKRFAYTVEVRNDAPLPLRVVGAQAAQAVLEPVREKTIPGGATALVTVRGRARCPATAVGGFEGADPQLTLGLRVRPPLGFTRSVASDVFASLTRGLCDAPPSPN